FFKIFEYEVGGVHGFLLVYGRFWFCIVTARGIFYGYSIEIIGDSHSESDKPNGGEQVQVRFEARFVGLIIIVFPTVFMIRQNGYLLS
ncbi:MAG: hypothetical protein J0M11_22770, partial [Anaerolineae bacterium]|nr:hypothetical protein [Anaerolineae bacterium]